MSKRQRKRCIVTNCNFEKVNPKLNCFRVPNDEREQLLWENALEQTLKKNQTVKIISQMAMYCGFKIPLIQMAKSSELSVKIL